MILNAATQDSSPKIHLPPDTDWQMLNKSKFFLLGAALFSGVSGTLYPMIVLKTRQQVTSTTLPCLKTAASILRSHGYRGLYAGFGTSLVGAIPARAAYTGVLEVTRSNIGDDVAGPAAANAAAGLCAAAGAQLVWTPVDVVTQRLMVRGGIGSGLDVFRRIVRGEGVRGLYRGFGVSLLTCGPCNAVWWASYSIGHRVIWAGVGGGPGGEAAVQGLSAAAASGVAAAVTMPLDTVKTRLQVLEGEGVVRTVRDLVGEGGLRACYRGFGPRWASMSVSATTMITTYEFLKRVCSKNHEGFV